MPTKRGRDRYGVRGERNYFRDREMIQGLVDSQPFVASLRSIPDNGTTSLVCPSCKKTDACWEEYFCRYCGEHNDKLYLSDHAMAPIALTRNQIIAEYESVGLRFLPKTNPVSTGLRFLSYADMTGINPWAEMPADPVAVKGGHAWEKLQGFRPNR